jgi:tetratricopeptide (TPR) repeat protein
LTGPRLCGHNLPHDQDTEVGLARRPQRPLWPRGAAREARKSSPEFAKILDSRALVLLRMGNFDKSIADYNASLKINPKNPWSLYGRGIDELRENKASAGQSDIARAEALSPGVAEEFTRRGLMP